VRLKSNQFIIEENGIKLRLNIIETSGYGDQINKEHSHEPITAYVDAQFEAYLQEELGLNRHFRQAEDTRIHACLYFLTPTGHSLKALDINTMRALDHKCNIIPIVAKSDTIGKCELAEFKKRIMAALADNGVEIYRFPVSENDLNVNNMNATGNVSCDYSQY
jgi:septin 6/8/11